MNAVFGDPKFDLAAFQMRYRPLFTAVGLTVFLLVLLWFAGWLLVGDELLPIRWGAYAAPWLALILGATSGILALGKRLWLAVASAVLTVVILSPVLPRFSPLGLFSPTQTSDLRVLTWNASEMNSDFRGLALVIAREKPDIVFLQQVRNLPSLQSEISRADGTLAYQNVSNENAETVILSRFALSLPQTYIGRTSAVARVRRCNVRLWSLHAPHGQFNIASQAHFFEVAAASFGNDDLPVIVGGDLNSTEFNSVQEPVRRVLKDAFASAGRGFGFTFPSHVRRLGIFGSLFRIDHIFTRGFRALASRVLATNANSDHFPVVADIAFTAPCQ